MYRAIYSRPPHYLEVSDQFHASAALPPEKDPRYSLNSGLDGPQNRAGRRGEEKNLDLPGLELRPLV
jgi:hypothetical protein